MEWFHFNFLFSFLRKSCSIFATSEAEKIAGIVVFLFLDRKLQGLSMILNKCMLSVIYFFKDKEWETSCANVAKHLAFRFSLVTKLPMRIRVGAHISCIFARTFSFTYLVDLHHILFVGWKFKSHAIQMLTSNAFCILTELGGCRFSTRVVIIIFLFV